MEFPIRRASPSESWLLSRIGFRSKAVWQYPPEYFLTWKQELTLTDDYIEKNPVYVAECESRTVGYYALVPVERDFRAGETVITRGWWLEHLFVLPEYLGQGFGIRLLNHALSLAHTAGQAVIRLFSDPHSRGFYEKAGGKYLYDSPSSIPGRLVPVYEIPV